MNASASLWSTIVAIGLYHGINPAMGWPIAVANGMTVRRASAVFSTLLPLGVGHLMAMMVVLVPFAWLGWFMEWSREIRISAGVLVLMFGVRMLIARGHPRFLARIKPTQLAWWSFLMATAHGAGLMLLPAMLGLCVSETAETAMSGHATVMSYLVRSSTLVAVLVAAVHTLAMLLAGTAMAWMTYRYLGLGFLRRAWLNLDQVWAASLIAAGAAGIAFAL
ncbi:hypothetical protein [Noviherbaspirillum saxi]|uniref:Uncharacterized protein n=1 Tax=Noviherbaspirillum saxi TaxID=2320863 RepID=A0A3A3FKR0_9BURK|nr:hypothetical protein [Noviherbaspirillum saxi]RJF95055.1 hypothetical protein D3871_16450 [Noviherbaspirillum saxi]